jgi:Mg2+/Co2+ transporter CorB
LFRVLNVRAEEFGAPALSMDEIRTIVLESSNILPKKHVTILLNLFDLEAITVDDVMVPRHQIEAIDIEAQLEDIVQQLATAHHRRVLVYRHQLDDIVGIVRVRHALNLSQQGELTKPRLRELVREPYFVPAGTALFAQLQNFQEQQERVSLVVDEYGELMGLVMLEDILEEIIGEFTTRSPLASGGFVRHADGSYVVEGGTLLRELNRKLALHFPLDGPRTINGLILEHLREIPEPNTSVKIAGCHIEILQTQDRLVRRVRIFPPAPRSAAGTQS